MQIQASWEFGFLHFYPEIFYTISSFSTFVSKVSYSRIKYILFLAQSRDPVGFHGPGLPPSGHRCPIKKGHPKEGTSPEPTVSIHGFTEKRTREFWRSTGLLFRNPVIPNHRKLQENDSFPWVFLTCFGYFLIIYWLKFVN